MKNIPHKSSMNTHTFIISILLFFCFQVTLAQTKQDDTGNIPLPYKYTKEEVGVWRQHLQKNPATFQILREILQNRNLGESFNIHPDVATQNTKSDQQVNPDRKDTLINRVKLTEEQHKVFKTISHKYTEEELAIWRQRAQKDSAMIKKHTEIIEHARIKRAQSNQQNTLKKEEKQDSKEPINRGVLDEAQKKGLIKSVAHKYSKEEIAVGIASMAELQKAENTRSARSENSLHDRYVATTGSDLNTGTQEKPYRTIQYAIDNCRYGTVRIADGRYEENIESYSNSNLCGNPANPGAVIIDGGKRGIALKIQSGNVSGLTITGGSDGALDVSFGYVYLSNVVITGNNGKKDDPYNAIITAFVAQMYVNNILVYGNSGNILHVEGESAYAGLKNVTIVDNITAVTLGAIHESRIDIENSIIRNPGCWYEILAEDRYGGGAGGVYLSYVSYSNILGGSGKIDGAGFINSIDRDPMFINPSQGQYQLSKFSPCVDTGNPEHGKDINFPPSHGSSRNDMGAYGGEAAAQPYQEQDEEPGEYNFHVSPTGRDENPGTKARPVQTIQHAINMAKEWDKIKIADGHYIENIVADKIIEIEGNVNNPESVIIDGNQQGTVIKMKGGFVWGVTITGGSQGAVESTYVLDFPYCSLFCVIIKENKGGDQPVVSGLFSSVFLLQSLVYNNTGDVLLVEGEQSYIQINQSTIAYNITTGTAIGVNSHGSVDIGNSILWNPGTLYEILVNPQSPKNSYVRYSNVAGGIQSTGNIYVKGSINQEPLFVDPLSGKFQLRSCSHCIDAGDPENGADVHFPPSRGLSRSDLGVYAGEHAFHGPYQVDKEYEPSGSEYDFYVSPTGHDNNPGTEALPFRTIQHAVNAASGCGYTIKLADGRYEETIEGLKVILHGNPASPQSVIIDGSNRGTVIKLIGGSDITGVTITGGIRAIEAGHSYFGDDYSWLLSHSIITGNKAGDQAVITCNQTGVFMRNCLVYKNTGTILLFEGEGSLGYLYNNTIVNNTIPDATIRTNKESAFIDLSNSIIRNPGARYELYVARESIGEIVSSNILGGNRSIINCRKTDDLADADPMFVNPAEDKYQLRKSSPCIDGGYPGYWWTEDSHLPPGRGTSRTDQGAYGGFNYPQPYQEYDAAEDPEEVTPSSKQNYIHTIIPQIAIKAIPQGLRNPVHYNDIIEYYDGLGRPMQTVAIANTPDEHDLVIPVVYDSFGRQHQQHLPYEASDGTGVYRSDAIKEQSDFYLGQNPGILVDNRPWGETQFEPSPLNRITAQYGPGSAWHTNSKSVNTQYQANAAQTVRLWKVTDTGADGTTYYKAGTLYRTVVLDEDNRQAVTYTDLQSRTIQQEQIDKDTIVTQYVYDDFGRLRYVIQPMASGKKSFTEGDTKDKTFEYYVFAYRYDARGRVIAKHIPGAGWTQIVYNKLDLPVLTSTAAQAAQSPQEWSFTKYDAHGRPVISGTLNSSNTREKWQELANSGTQWEVRSSEAGNTHRYTNQCQPVVTEAQVHQVSYYDHYDFDQSGAPASREPTIQIAQGLPTGSKTRILPDGKWLTSIVYYDAKGRIQETINQNQLDKWETVYNSYDFTGRLLTATRTHRGGKEVVIGQEITYDHAGRPVDLTYEVGIEKTLVSHNEYNKLGQLKSKKLHRNKSGGWLQEIDYDYNIRGWLTGINAAADAQDAFSQRLLYHEPLKDISASIASSVTPQYNGNITATRWIAKAPGTETAKAVKQLERYEYDALNRLMNSQYGADTLNNGKHSDRNAHYKTSYKYNRNSSITDIQRDHKGVSIDNSSQAGFEGNRLVNIKNWRDTPIGIRPSTYTYDASGRMLTDKQKGITVSYNHLNLATGVSKGSEKLEYIYDATGRRLTKKFGGAERHYIDGIEYEGNTLKFITMPEGRIRPKGDGWVYDYFLTDHLGDVRMVLTTDAASRQVYMATMEEKQAGEETQYFENLETTRADRPYNYPDINPANAKLAKVPGKSEGPKLTLKVMAGDTIEIRAQAFYNIDKTLPGQSPDIAPVLGSAIAAMASGGAAPLGEAAMLAAELGTVASTSVALVQVPDNGDNDNNDPTPQAGLNFVAYNVNFEVVAENTGILPVTDRINKIQNLSSDRIVIQENGFIEVFANNEAQTPVFFDNLSVSHSPGRVLEENHYYPYGLLIPGLSSSATVKDERNSYKYNQKELQEEMELGWLDYGARMQNPAEGRFMVPDRFAEKYYHLSPYSYAAGNPISNIDVNGDSISVADLYAKGEHGNFKSPDQVAAFEFLASTKEGKALLANYAEKGQVIAGVTFNKDGAFHKKGINLSFDTNISNPMGSGVTSFTLGKNSLNIRIGVGSSSDIGDLVDTYTHEIAIHADQNSTDFIDDRVMNSSNVYPALRQENNRTFQNKQHWQERNVNRAMEKIGVPIMQQYYISRGIIKSNDEILKTVYNFRNN